MIKILFSSLIAILLLSSCYTESERQRDDAIALVNQCAINLNGKHLSEAFENWESVDAIIQTGKLKEDDVTAWQAELREIVDREWDSLSKPSDRVLRSGKFSTFLAGIQSTEHERAIKKAEDALDTAESSHAAESLRGKILVRCTSRFFSPEAAKSLDFDEIVNALKPRFAPLEVVRFDQEKEIDNIGIIEVFLADDPSVYKNEEAIDVLQFKAPRYSIADEIGAMVVYPKKLRFGNELPITVISTLPNLNTFAMEELDSIVTSRQTALNQRFLYQLEDEFPTILDREALAAAVSPTLRVTDSTDEPILIILDSGLNDTILKQELLDALKLRYPNHQLINEVAASELENGESYIKIETELHRKTFSSSRYKASDPMYYMETKIKKNAPTPVATLIEEVQLLIKTKTKHIDFPLSQKFSIKSTHSSKSVVSIKLHAMANEKVMGEKIREIILQLP